VDRVIRDDDIRIDSGRASGGQMFVRVVHQPTDTSRQVVGLGDRAYAQVVAELRAAVEDELAGRGWARAAEGSQSRAAEPGAEADSGPPIGDPAS
jgi:hypothetical protein